MRSEFILQRLGPITAKFFPRDLPQKPLSYPAHIALTTLGVIAELEGDLVQAFGYYEQSLKIAEVGDAALNTLNNMEGIFFALGELDKSIHYLSQTIDESKKFNFYNLIPVPGFSLSLQGTFESSHNDIESLLSYNGDRWFKKD